MNHIISDVHGCLFTLESLIKRVKHSDPDAKFIFTGDYADRGLHSKQVVDLLLEMNDAVFVRGNHDNILDWLLNDQCIGDITAVATSTHPEDVVRWWTWNGFAETLDSYGMDSSIDLNDPLKAFHKFREVVPQSHKDFYRNLKSMWQNDTHFCCHAYYNPKLEVPTEIDETDVHVTYDIMWTRFPYLYMQQFRPVEPVWDKIGVFGHTPVSRYNARAPIKYDKIRLIDTGACSGEYLCSYTVELDDHLLESTDDRDISKTK